MTRPWRVAAALLELRDQIDATWPQRNKASDGTIGDAAHQSRDSDHNPWYSVPGAPAVGVVTALDITHDPAHGVDIDKLTDVLAASRDPRIKYLIANGLILDTRAGQHPWQWMPYDGTDSHHGHMHLSVTPALCDELRPWTIQAGQPAPPAGPGGPRPGYPTLCRGTGGVGDPTGSWWAAKWYALMAANSPGYYAEIATDPAGAQEIAGHEVGDVTLRVAHKVATQVLGDQLTWRGGITQQVWSIFPPIS